MRKVLDLSNYDYYQDIRNVYWVEQMERAGVEAVILGSQWPDATRWQADQIQSRSKIELLGTYAEPDVDSAIAIAKEYKMKLVGLVTEPGSILDQQEMLDGIDKVRQSYLDPYVYGNRGDLSRIISGKEEQFRNTKLWLANYGTNDPNEPTAPIKLVSLGPWGEVAIHQYSSTIVVAGRVRDHNYLLIEPEEEMTEDRVRELIREAFVQGYNTGSITSTTDVLNCLGQVTGVLENTYSDKVLVEAIRTKIALIADEYQLLKQKVNNPTP